MYRSTEAGWGWGGTKSQKRNRTQIIRVSGIANDITAEYKNIKAQQGTIINQFVPINQAT